MATQLSHDPGVSTGKVLLTFGSMEGTWQASPFRNRTSKQNRQGHRIAPTRSARIAKSYGKRKKD